MTQRRVSVVKEDYALPVHRYVFTCVMASIGLSGCFHHVQCAGVRLLWRTDGSQYRLVAGQRVAEDGHWLTLSPCERQ